MPFNTSETHEAALPTTLSFSHRSLALGREVPVGAVFSRTLSGWEDSRVRQIGD